MAIDNASLTMKPRQVTDVQSGLVAYTYLAPEGWDIQDQVVWDRNNMYNPAHLFAHCYNNDGHTIQIQAGYTNRYWATPMGNSGNYPPRDITEALMIYLPWLRGVNVQFTEATILSSSQQPNPYGQNIIHQYGRIRGNYEKNGIRFDEILYGTMTMTQMRQGPDLTGFFYEDISWDINDLFLSCASGTRDPEAAVATALSIKSSAKQTQAFYDHELQTVKLLKQQYDLYNNQRSVTAKQPVNEPVKESRNYMKEANDYINNLWEENRKAGEIRRDKDHEQFVDYIKDVERYTDRKGTEYLVPAGYRGAYVSSLGKILLVDKNGFDPDPIDTSYETWTRLYKKEY